MAVHLDGSMTSFIVTGIADIVAGVITWSMVMISSTGIYQVVNYQALRTRHSGLITWIYLVYTCKHEY